MFVKTGFERDAIGYMTVSVDAGQFAFRVKV